MFKGAAEFNIQQLSESGVSVNMNAVQIKLGVVF